MRRRVHSKIGIFYVLFLISALLLAGCGGAPATAPQKSEAIELKYGVAMALSGGGAAIGLPVKRAYEMVAEDIGEFSVAGQTYRWKIVAEDNKYTSEAGVAAARKMLFQDEVSFMMQMGSASALASQPIAEGARVLFEPWAASPDVMGPAHATTVRIYQSSYEFSPGLLYWISQNRPELKRMVYVAPDDATGAHIAKAANLSAKAFGLEVLDPVFYPRETADFYPLLLRVLPQNPDIIFIEGGANAAGFLKGAREQGWRGQFVGITLYPAWVEIVGKDMMDGMLFSDPAMGSPLTPEPWNQLRSAYLDRFGEEPGGLIRYPHAALHVMTEALKKAGTVEDVDKILAVIENEMFETPLGTLLFGGEDFYGIKRQLVLPSFVSQYKDGEERGIARYEPEEAAKLIKQVFGK